MSVVLVERRAAIGLVTINRPKALNALDADVLDGLEQAFADLGADPEVRVIVLTGAGGKAFVAGADISAMASFDPVTAERFAARGQAVLNGIASCPKPVIAAVGGFALGGGCELAMACDIVVTGGRARFGQPEVKLGVIPGFGGTQRLIRRVGMTAALDMCLTGRLVGAAEAVTMGLASRFIEGDVLEGALAVAAEVAAMGPVAVRLAKRSIHENADVGLQTALGAERSLFALCFATEDQSEGMAAFLEKRTASFKGV
jgi:enoyl-CoA hydratase